MKKKIAMTADELKLDMLVHPPDWTTAPDRVAQLVEKTELSSGRFRLKVDGAPAWTVYGNDYVTTVKP